MSALDALVRLQRWQLDERRRELGDLDQLAHKLRQEAERLDLDRNGHAVERGQRIAQSLAAIEQQIALAREALGGAYQELKRSEMAAASRILQQRRAAPRQQQRAGDETSPPTYQRRRRQR
ncbi:MAG TPA: hypothetical protein VN832_14550 [Stellaceae bacterium]|nr:hypothetical protein [Stellaceae bacterium]